MKGGQLILALRRIVEELGRDGKNTLPRPSPLSRLDDLLDLRSYVEERGKYTVIQLEAFRRLLYPKKIDTVASLERRMKPFIIGIDSSSRSLETGNGAIIIGSSSIASVKPTVAIEWPDTSDPHSSGPPFISLLGSLSTLDTVDYVTLRSPAGHPYDAGYSIQQALDEMRLLHENWILSRAAPAIAEWAERRGYQPVVLVDGPVYPVTMAFQGGAEGDRARYYDAWKTLLDARLDAVRRLEEKGVPVIGVVKRLSRSTIISRIARISSPLRDLLGEGEYSDIQALNAYYQYIISGASRPGRLYVSPRAKVVIAEGRLSTPIGKIVEYLAVPPGRWYYHPGGAKFYRVEYSESTMRILEDYSAKASFLVSIDSALRGSGIPVSIAIADWRSKTLSRALHSLLASLAVRRGIPLGYESMVEVRGVWRETRNYRAY